jgi:hypothetical protein
MPPQNSSISSRMVMPGGRQLHAGLAHPARHREGAQALAAVAALAREPVRTVLDDVAHPEQGLDVVDERRAAEEADLARERGLVARQAALALDRFEHRGFLAADIGARAAAQMDLGVAREPRFLSLAISRSRISRTCGYSSRR